jgi:hypothetical protein
MPTVGQTGSGKSYTMMGYGEMGLIPRICSGIFDRAAKELIKEPDSSFVAEVGYLEIYNEKVCARVCVCVCARSLWSTRDVPRVCHLLRALSS